MIFTDESAMPVGRWEKTVRYADLLWWVEFSQQYRENGRLYHRTLIQGAHSEYKLTGGRKAVLVRRWASV